MKKDLFALILLSFVCNIALGQIKGHVKTADGKPAAYSTVALYKDHKTNVSPVKYTTTDKNGNFTLNTQAKDGMYITIRYVGYKEYRKELKEGENNLAVQLELNDKSNLNEVTVKSTYTGVRVSGDTIAFDTEHFKTGEEETVSEVLKKLPGMEVSDNGDVKFGGKAVDKVLVDGKDMFTSGSDGVINNMSADAMKGAEILRNYKTNSLIDEFRSDELLALNIKTDGRLRLSGKASLFAGYKNKLQGNGNLLFMGKNAYLTTTLSGNNTGEQLLSFSDYVQNIVGLDNILSNVGKKGRMFSEEDVALLFPPQNVYQSKNGLFSLSGTYKPSDAFKLQGSVITNMSEVDAESLSEQLYHAFNVTNTHFLENKQKNRFFSFNLRETYKPKANVEISNSTHLSRTALQTDDTLSENGLTNMFASQDSELKKVNFNDEMALNVKTGKGLVSAHLSFDRTRRNFSYGLLTDRDLLPATYSVTAANYYSLDTKRKITNTTLSPDITYAYPITKKLNLQTTLAYNYNRNAFEYEDLSSPVNEHLTWHDYSASLSLSKNKGFLWFSVGAELRNTRWSSSISGLEKGNKTFLLPKASISLHFSTTHQLTLTADMNNNAIETEYLLKNPMVRSYGSMYGGSNITDPFSKSKNVNLNYSYHNLYTNTMLFFNGGLSESEVTKAHTLQDSSIVTISKYDNDGLIKSRYFSGHFSQGLGSLPVDAQLGASLSSSASETELNGIQDEVNSLSYSVNVGLRSRMKKIINFELGFNYSDSKYDYSVSTVSSSMSQIGGNAALIFVYKNFKGNVHYSFTNLDDASFGRNYSDLGFRIEYRINKWRIHIQGNNILNLKDMDWVSISANQSFTSSTFFRKIPGYIVGGFSYRF